MGNLLANDKDINEIESMSFALNVERKKIQNKN